MLMKMTDGNLKKYKLWRDQNCSPWGFKITTFENKTYIANVFNDTPAERAGLGLNEIILTINRVPCDNVPHDYICHVLRKVDHNMVLVTRKPTKDEAQSIFEIAKDIPIKGYYIQGGGVNSVSKKNVKNERKPKSTENMVDSGNKDEGERTESNLPDSRRKDRAPWEVVASDSYLSKRRHLVEDIELDSDYEAEIVKLNHQEETPKANSKTLPSTKTKDGMKIAAHKNGKSYERKLKTLDNKRINDVECGQEAVWPQINGRGDGDSNHQEEKKGRNNESQGVDSNKYDGIGKPTKRKEEPRSKPKELTTKPTNDASPNKTTKSETRIDKKSAVARRKTNTMPSSKKESHHLVKSKSTAAFDTEGSKKMNHLDEDDAAAVKEMKQSFPSMVELRSNLQAGKRRTLLLSRGDSFEDRVAMLNDL